MDILKKLSFALFGLLLNTTPVLAAQTIITNPKDDPIKDAAGLGAFIARLQSIVLWIGGGVAVAMFIYGGTLYILSGGDEEKIKKGRTALGFAALGVILIAAAQVLVVAYIKLLGGNYK